MISPLFAICSMTSMHAIPVRESGPLCVLKETLENISSPIRLWYIKDPADKQKCFEQDKDDFDSFATIVRKFVGIRELTPTIVNEFVKKIIVHTPDKSSGHRRQKIKLVWNFIGEVNLPGDDQTVERQRKGRAA